MKLPAIAPTTRPITPGIKLVNKAMKNLSTPRSPCELLRLDRLDHCATSLPELSKPACHPDDCDPIPAEIIFWQVLHDGARIESSQQWRTAHMNLVLNLSPDLEADLKKRAEQAGLDMPTYVLQTLRTTDLEQVGDISISNEQFDVSLKRLLEIHANVPAHFDDSRESIYEGRGE